MTKQLDPYLPLTDGGRKVQELKALKQGHLKTSGNLQPAAKSYERAEHTISIRLTNKLAEHRKGLEQRDIALEVDVSELLAGRSSAFVQLISSVPISLRIDLIKTLDTVSENIGRFHSKLSRNIQMSVQYNDYGKLISDNRSEETLNFLSSIDVNYPKELQGLMVEYIIFEVERINSIQAETGFDLSSLPINGFDFEHWVASSLSKFGWKVKVTQGSGDQGVDVIATINGKTLGIQCKRYAGSVGNKAVQETYAGMKHFGLDYAAVLTNATYTKSARELAASTNVLLLVPEDIPSLSERHGFSS